MFEFPIMTSGDWTITLIILGLAWGFSEWIGGGLGLRGMFERYV
jgi:hypothetical protein